MNLFDPRTFSTDWEIIIIDRLNRVIDSDRLMGFAGALREALELPVTVDVNSLEMPMGVNSSFAQFQERILRATDLATQVFGSYDLDLYPAAAHPVEMLFSSSHIHVGTILDETAAIRLENQLYRFMPAFAALAANSPVPSGMRGDYKSYRVRYQARGCTRPGSIRDPYLAQFSWGTDANAKLIGVPTLEVRITDCASSRQFLAELGVFVAAFVHQQGTMLREEPPAHAEYRDFLINRWAAAKYGLQATFHWNGATRPVVEILDEMLASCAEALEVLGASRTTLPLIAEMLHKRVCQADWAMALAARYPDHHLFASAYGKVLRHWGMFEEYLSIATPLEPVAAPDEEAVLAIHLETIGEGTHFYRTRDAMAFPPPLADEMIDCLEARGMIRREVSLERGLVLSRVQALE